MTRIAALNVYPVKSLGGIALTSATLTAEGLAMDRRWVITDASGRFVTQRDLPGMAVIETALDTHHLILCAPDRRHLYVPLALPDGPEEPVRIFRDDCRGIDEGEEASEWLTHVLGAWRGGPLRLRRVPPDNRRRVDPQRLGRLQARTGFADGFPLLITSNDSLQALNERLKARGMPHVPMSRFRPNIVIDGAAAFAEHRHAGLSGGDFSLWLCKPCERCRITTINQCSGEIPVAGEPLATLSEYRNISKPGAFFGENAVVTAGAGALLRIGDPVRLLDEPMA